MGKCGLQAPQKGPLASLYICPWPHITLYMYMHAEFPTTRIYAPLYMYVHNMILTCVFRVYGRGGVDSCSVYESQIAAIMAAVPLQNSV